MIEQATRSPKAAHRRKKYSKTRLKRDLYAYALILPSLLLFAFFIWIPMVMNIVLSFFTDYSFSTFAGFANYRELFSDPAFSQAFGNTFIYIFWSLAIGFLLPIILGLLLSEVAHATGFFRIGIYFPAIISGIAVAFLFQSLYSPESFGVLNTILKNLGLSPSLWADDRRLVIPLIVLAMTWKGAGGTVLIYLSALQTVDNSLYEAVRLDGGGLLRRFRHVTFPHLKPMIATMFILQIISVFQVFYEPMVIGHLGGPDGASTSLMFLSYKYAFMDGEQALGAACGVILSLVILVFSGFYFLVDRLVGGKEKA